MKSSPFWEALRPFVLWRPGLVLWPALAAALLLVRCGPGLEPPRGENLGDGYRGEDEAGGRAAGDPTAGPPPGPEGVDDADSEGAAATGGSNTGLAPMDAGVTTGDVDASDGSTIDREDAGDRAR